MSRNKKNSSLKYHKNSRVYCGFDWLEGDFNKDEVDYAVKNDFEPLSLGNNRLRSETAAIVVSSAFSSFK